ncbi:ATP-binding protein [bacterium]|nr:ATP-binding protein [bacterium]
MHSKKQGTLIVFSGLPASGKTTLATMLATHLQATYLRMDAIVLGIKSDNHSPELPEKCYRVARSLASVNLQIGNTVITDSINPSNQLRDEWTELAKTLEAKLLHIEIVCTSQKEHQQRLKDRTTALLGLKDPTWQEIQEIEYHQWNQERILIETAGKTVETSFEEILSALK